ncbi:hypothetical protein KKC93_02655 [Patescibacteria group bacterium]|nr:hypothetical protein [Patescibacteria group bacterium]
MSRTVVNLIKKIERQRGRGAEVAVGIALDEMARDGEIVSFYKTGRHADKFQGIDFFVIKISGEKIPLQVKSSQTSVLNHWKKFPNVPAIVVKTGDDAKTIKTKIWSALE